MTRYVLDTNIFVHALAGATRFSNVGSSTEFSLGFGGGVDVSSSDRIAIRLVGAR